MFKDICCAVKIYNDRVVTLDRRIAFWTDELILYNQTPSESKW
jgi:hypothetical protein